MNKARFFASSLIILSVLSSTAFFYWALNAVYDVKQLEQQGHIAYAAKQYPHAYQAFTHAAAISAKQPLEQNKTSHLYRYAGSSAYKLNDYELALEKVTIALRYKPDNAEAIHLIKHMLHTKQISQQQVERLQKEAQSLVDLQL